MRFLLILLLVITKPCFGQIKLGIKVKRISESEVKVEMPQSFARVTQWKVRRTNSLLRVTTSFARVTDLQTRVTSVPTPFATKFCSCDAVESTRDK